MSAHHRTRNAGVTLVEAALVVCIAGVLLAVFVPTFFRELRTSKISEASTQLATMHQATAAYFSTRHGIEGAPRVTRCLPPSAGPAPAMPSVDPVVVDFAGEDTPGFETFAALGFVPEQAVRYRYSFLPIKDGCNLAAPAGRPLVLFRAEGDLDGDGKLSLFERRAAANEAGELVPIGVLRVEDRIE